MTEQETAQKELMKAVIFFIAIKVTVAVGLALLAKWAKRG